MLTVDIPGWRSLQLEFLVLDVNGTLTLDGEQLAGVDANLNALIQFGVLNVQLISADTFGRLDTIAAELREAVDRAAEALSDPVLEQILALRPRTVLRVVHRQEHLAQIEEALSRSA